MKPTVARTTKQENAKPETAEPNHVKQDTKEGTKAALLAVHRAVASLARFERHACVSELPEMAEWALADARKALGEASEELDCLNARAARS